MFVADRGSSRFAILPILANLRYNLGFITLRALGVSLGYQMKIGE